MEKYFIEGTPKTPAIHFDADKGALKIWGRSNPENSKDFFAPLMEWLAEYLKHPASLTTLTIDLEHFNTSTSKYVLDILKRIKNLADSNNPYKVVWMYEEDDDEMLDTAEAYEAMVGFSFEKVTYPERE